MVEEILKKFSAIHKNFCHKKLLYENLSKKQQCLSAVNDLFDFNNYGRLYLVAQNFWK